MDNNYFNNNTDQTTNNAQQAQTNAQQSAYSSQQATGYNAYGSQQQNTYHAYGSYNAYGNAQQSYNPYQQPVGGGKKPKKAKMKRGGFGATLGKCAAIALVFGLVAGGTFTGVN